MTVDIWIRDYNPPRCFQKKISGRSKHNAWSTKLNSMKKIWYYRRKREVAWTSGWGGGFCGDRRRQKQYFVPYVQAAQEQRPMKSKHFWSSIMTQSTPSLEHVERQKDLWVDVQSITRLLTCQCIFTCSWKNLIGLLHCRDRRMHRPETKTILCSVRAGCIKYAQEQRPMNDPIHSLY
jgi:hypothetical protein